MDPDAREVAWRAEFEGEPVAGSHAGFRPIARDGVGATVTDARVLAVTSGAGAYDWSAIRAVARSGGAHEWSFRAERRLAVHGVADGTVYATGREYFEPESAHDTPDEPLSSVLYALDAGTGEVRWTRAFAGVVDVAVGTGGVYVASVDGLAALGLEGSRRWTVGGDAEGRAVRAAEDRIFYLAAVDHDRSDVYGLSPGGEVEWTTRLPVHEVLLDGDRLYAGGEDTLALEPDGSVAWRDNEAYGQWLLLSPDGETLYTRAGRGQDRARAYRAADGTRRWTYRPRGLSSNNAWPVAATAEAAVVEGITAEHGDDPFTTLYAVRDGEATKALATEPVFDVEGFGDAVFLAGGSVVALEPTPGSRLASRRTPTSGRRRFRR